MDKFDTSLLSLLQEDARRSVAELAEIVGLSTSATAKRTARLWTQNYITRQVVKLNRKRFRRPVTAMVTVKLTAPKATVSTQFAKHVTAFQEVVQCHAVTGDFDYLLMVCERSIEEYHAFAQNTFGTLSIVQSYKTTFVLSTAKNEDILPDFALAERVE
jgi:DNA-binding Lrp family transcriptional regulator